MRSGKLMAVICTTAVLTCGCWVQYTQAQVWKKIGKILPKLDPTRILPKFDPTQAIPFPKVPNPLPRLDPTRVNWRRYDPTVPLRAPADWIRQHAQPGDIVITRHRTTFYGFYGHAAIVADPQTQTLIESYAYHPGTDRPGTVESSWDMFRKRSTMANPMQRIILLRVRGITPDQAMGAVTWCREHLGIPYRWPGVDGSDKNNEHRMYCSQLVWMAYSRITGIDIARNGDVIVSPDDLLSNKTMVVASLNLTL